MRPFKSSRLLLARAQEHIDQFNHLENGFLARNPYSYFTDRDPETGQTRYKIKVSQRIGDRLPVIAFDIVNCLRSALDHAVFDSAKAIGGTPKPRDTKFPFGATREQAERNLDRYKGSEVPLEIRPVLLEFEPFKGGALKIWELNELRNQKIHRILKVISASANTVHFGDGTMNATISMCSEWDDELNELTYMRIEEGATGTSRLYPSVNIAFVDRELFGGESTQRVFSSLLHSVKTIVERIEQETSRLSEASTIR